MCSLGLNSVPSAVGLSLARSSSGPAGYGDGRGVPLGSCPLLVPCQLITPGAGAEEEEVLSLPLHGISPWDMGRAKAERAAPLKSTEQHHMRGDAGTVPALCICWRGRLHGSDMERFCSVPDCSQETAATLTRKRKKNLKTLLAKVPRPKQV